MKTKTLSYSLFICSLLLASCTKNSDKDTSITIKSGTSIVLNHEESMLIDASSAQSITYSSKNKYHAEVSTGGLVTAKYVGETEIILDNGSSAKSVSVEVEPIYNLYETPCLEWGISKSAVISKYGSPDIETSQGVGYKSNSDAAPISTFLFDSSLKLIASSVLVKTDYGETLGDFLTERYLPISVDMEEYSANFVDALTSEGVNSRINMSVYNLAYLQVLYIMADEESVKTKSSDINLKNTHKALVNLMLKQL